MEAEGFHSISKRSWRDKDEEDADGKQVGSAGGIRHLQNVSSRIFTVSRASGSKDRHSKVLTAKGLRDRRIRLSVSTAIQFYDLQDRLGYEQPSNAVDWLIKAADSAIAELPELNASFPAPPPTALPGRAKLPEKAAADELQPSLSKSTCSSTSETSKGSVLSLSRCESRVKTQGHHNVNTQSSFTQLLTAESGPNATGVMDCGPAVTSTTDYFGQAGTFGYPCKPQQVAPSYSHFGNSPNRGMGMMPCSSSMAANGEHQELQHFSVIQDHVIPVAAASPARDYYNLNVSISSGFAGFNRGTLQSNSPHHHHLSDGDDLPFFFGAALPVVATAGNSMENQFHGGFNGRLDYYSEARKHPDLKGEDKG